MSAEDNKAITRRINEEVWTNGNLDVIEDLIADDYIHTVVGVLPAASRGVARRRSARTQLPRTLACASVQE